MPGSPRIRRRRRIIAGVFLALSAAVVAPYVVGRLGADARSVTITAGTAPPAHVDTPRPLRIATWNVAHGRGTADSNLHDESVTAQHARLTAIGDALRTFDADVIVLNEVDVNAFWSDGIDQVAAISGVLDPHVVVVQRNVDVRHPAVALTYGNAVLSRHPITDAQRIDLPAASWLKDRLVGAKDALRVTVTPDGAPSFVLYAVHLHPHDRAVRTTSIDVLLADAAELDLPAVIAGDLNAAPDDLDDAIARLRRAGWHVVPDGADAAPTFPADAPTRAIDWIAVAPSGRLTDRIVSDAVHSDHRAVVGVVQFDAETASSDSSAESGAHAHPGTGS